MLSVGHLESANEAIESMTNERIDSILTQFLNIDDFQLEENLVHPQQIVYS